MLKFLMNKKMHAFTLIELMTTTLIMAIIICAAIPFAMKKDIQKRAVAGHVGVFECYYDKKNGNKFTQHIRTKEGEDKITYPSGDTCTFNPNAEYAKGAKNFQIVAIGGGGAGGTYNDQGASDDALRAAIQVVPKQSDTLASSHIKHLMDHGRMALGTLSNAGGTNAWYWNGQTQSEECYNDFWRSGCWCYKQNTFGNNNCYCSTKSHQDFKVVCRKTKNDSNSDYISVNNIGPRLCSLNYSSKDDIKEEDIFQAIYKHYGVAGSFVNGTIRGDIEYNMQGPSGLASCACLNDAVYTSYGDGSCMGRPKSSSAGAAGSRYKYSTYTGVVKAAFMGDDFATPASRDKTAINISNHCSNALSLAGTSFDCGSGNGGKNSGCQGSKSGTQLGYARNFPTYYYWGNDYSSGKANTGNHYEQVKMSYTNDEGSLANYGGDIHFRVVSHANGEGYAIVPRGQHGDNPVKNGNRVITTGSAIKSTFKGFIAGQQGFSAGNNPGSACTTPNNRINFTAQGILYQVGAQCSDRCSYTYTCGSKTCRSSVSCSDSDYWYNYWPRQTSITASCYRSGGCTASCTATNNKKRYTDSAGTCYHLNCCNKYANASKQYTVRYFTGTSLINSQSSGKAELTAKSQTLNCGDNLYVYRQIKGVPYERAFVASAGQNGAVKQGSYPKLDEQLILKPGKGGIVGGDDTANGQPSIVRKSGGQVILSAQGGIKGASDKLNDTWVGPCMLFSLRENFDVNNPGCLARHDVMRKPTYNSLLMSNSEYLKSAYLKTGSQYDQYVKYMPGLGGDGAYANVFPDRFLLSKAIRDGMRLTTNYIGPNQNSPWSDSEFTMVGLDAFTTPEFIGTSKYGDDNFATLYKQRYAQLTVATSNFLRNTQHKGRVPNFIKASDGNNGAIVIIW